MTGNRRKPSEDGRAWVEIDLPALSHNLAELRGQLRGACEIMAVIKADAYGHGAPMVAAHLRREGVNVFAAVTVTEGIELRESGLDGEILILGYTHPKDAGLLSDYNLIQMVADGAHAKALDEAGNKLRVHIAVDTGMHRQGIEYSNIAEIEGVYACKNLIVEGIASHLAVSDSRSAGDIEFTNTQIERFFSVADTLKNAGRSVGKLHISASYGIYGYPGLACDYVRAGIALYGVMSHNGEMSVKPDLRPVLSLRARIAEVRWIGAGESVSYGRLFTAKESVKLATIAVGYADGVPRQMSGNGGLCIIRGNKAPIIGRICMDFIMADVTEIDSVEPGDIATLIGRDGAAEIRCEDFAEACGTITNDILCRLGGRLPRVYI